MLLRQQAVQVICKSSRAETSAEKGKVADALSQLSRATTEKEQVGVQLSAAEQQLAQYRTHIEQLGHQLQTALEGSSGGGSGRVHALASAGFEPSRAP